MNNDLISREALKKKLTPIKLYGGVYCKAITEKDIDNAPTITPTFQLKDITDEDVAKFAMIWQRATSKGLILEPERPHGKWVEDWREDLDSMSKKGWRCSFCKYRTTYGKSNFCMNCGADMREDSDE